MDDRLPPHDREVERALLGTMFRNERTIPEATVSRKDFYVHAHGLIFQAMLDLADKHQRADLVTVAEKLRRAKLLDEIGGPAYLADLWDHAPSAQAVSQYCAVIREYSQRRQLLHACTEIMANAIDMQVPIDDVLGAAERNVLGVADVGSAGQAIPMQQAMQESLEVLDARREGKSNGIPSGLQDLDMMLGGFQPSELIVIGARPSVGKTSLGVSIVRHVAVERKLPVFFVSLEQSRVEIAHRMLSAQARIKSEVMRHGNFTEIEREALMSAHAYMDPAKVYFDDEPQQSIRRIVSNARRIKRKYGIQLIVIDYLQLINSDLPKGAGREEQISDASRRLKYLARELQVPVIVLAQLNRESEGRSDNRPRLSELRGSGAIEQDADAVLLLHRNKEAEMTIIVAKQRNGPTGDVPVVFRKEFMVFEDAQI